MLSVGKAKKICGILRTFESKHFRITKSRPSRNHLDRYFEKLLRKIINYKKFEEQPKN